MTDIMRMAREAGAMTGTGSIQFRLDDGALERFAALVAAHEREAILQMSEDNWFKTQDNYEAAIRARGNNAN
jgi:hypothetical protein